MTWREYNNMNTFLSTTIERWPVDRLIPYARNARTHSDEQIEQIARSIREFGFTNPILVDTGAGILAGHARLLAARRVGLARGARDHSRPPDRNPEKSLHPGR